MTWQAVSARPKKEALKLRVKDAEVVGLADTALHIMDTHFVPSFIMSSGIL
jgi:hypothetical protein